MRTWAASIVTLIFLALVTCYCYFNWQQVRTLNPNEIGDLVAGIGSILAFLWLIFGYFQQGQELKENTIALQGQEKQLLEQAKQTKELARFAKAQSEAMNALAQATKQSVSHDKSLSENAKKANDLTSKLIASFDNQSKATEKLVKAIHAAAIKLNR